MTTNEATPQEQAMSTQHSARRRSIGPTFRHCRASLQTGVKSALLVAGMTAAACTTAVAPNGSLGTGGSSSGSAGSAGETPGPTSPSGGAGTVTGGSAGMAGATASVDNGLPGRSLIRRLSNVEYGATIKSLLGDTTDYAAAFPTDSVVNGFTNNTDVQDVGPALAEQFVVVAEKIAAKAAQNADTLLGCKLADGDTCVGSFIDRFGRRAWRRPIDATEKEDLLGVFRKGRDAYSATMGLQLLIETFLVSPSFLYRAEVGVPVAGQPYAELTSWEIASRLSYFLTGTMPDDLLFAAAEADSLRTKEGIEAQARRLLGTSAARSQVADFFSGWLNLRAVERLERDPVQFPQWKANLPSLLTAETRAFATAVIFDGQGDLPTLLTAPFTYGDPSLAAFYGGQAGPAQGNVARIDLPADKRAGILTQASFLATHAKEIQTDPVARGKFIRERILCQGIAPPPADAMIVAPTVTPGTTTRQRFMEHEAEPVCAACHKLIDPIGLAFEHYDAAGSWRDMEQGQPIDASGDLTATDVSGAFVGVVEMTKRLAKSEIVSECFVRNWFRFTFGRGESDSETARIETITKALAGADGKVLELLVALTTTPDFRYLPMQGTL